MVTYIPDSNIERFFTNSSKSISKTNFNSGFIITDNLLVQNQKLMQNAIREYFKDILKYPGIVPRIQQLV